MAWKDIKEQRKSGKSSWADVKRSRGIGDGDTSEDGVSRLVGATKINTKDLTKGRATNTSPITVDPKVVIEAKQNRYRVPDATSDPDFEKYSTLGNRKAESGKIKIGPVEIKSGFNRLDNSEDYMQPGEKKIYDYWIGKGDKESATKFLKGLEPEINRRRAFKEDQMMTDITRNSKAAGVAMELTTNLAAPAGYLSTAKDFITGEDIDPNSPAYMAARATNSIENELFRESSDFTKFLGQTGLSMGKFATALPFGQVGALTIMSSGAAGSTAWDATNRGASTNEAMMLGTAAGITEYLTEKLPVDNLFRLAKSGVNLVTKEGVKQVLKQAGIEGTEEVVSQYVNTLTDIAVMGSRSNYERYKAELVASGLSIEEAESQAKIDMFVKEPAIAFAGGALSGGVFGAGAGAVSTYNVSKVGSQMRGLGIEQDIVDTGLESGAETGSNQTATKVADIMKAGGKVSNYDIGKLYYENINAVNAENDEAQRKGIESMLRDAGVTEAEPISRVMQKAFSGDPLSNTEAEAIITNEAARNMFTSFTGQDIPIGTMSSMRRAVKGFSENVVKGTAQPILIQPNEAQIEPQPDVNAKMEQPVAAAPKMNVQPQQTMERPLSREEIKAQVSKFGQAGAKSYGVNLKDQQDINKYTAGFSAYYIAGKSGLSYDDTMKANSNYDLPDTVKFSAYSAGQNDAKTDTKSKPVYSKEAGLKQTEESKDIKKNVAKVLDSIGKATGVKVVMVKSIDVNGEKAAANGLYMNGVLQIASDAVNPILVVAKHEVTHRLQETSPEAYKEYKDYVVQVMIKQGTLAENMKKLDILYKKHGKQMSHDEILDEIVANFTEQILTDVDAINDLVRTNRTLAQQILDMLREFMVTIKEAIGKVDPSVRNQLGFNYDELKKAEALWVKALKTAEEGESVVTSNVKTETVYGLDGKPVEAVDGNVILYHNTTKESAEAIYKSGVLDPNFAGTGNDKAITSDGKVSYTTTNNSQDFYGDTTVKVVMPIGDFKKQLQMNAEMISRMEKEVADGKVPEMYIDGFKMQIENFRKNPEIISDKPLKVYRATEEGENDTTVTSEEEMESSYVQYSLVKDKETLDFLENQNQVPVYRAMQVIDGKLYPPMAAKVANDGKRNLVMPSELNAWEQADERPDLIKNGKFTLDKANGSSIAASYNPYFHTSRSLLNDQFSSAYKRPNIVVVEGLVPESELTSKYHAPYAKDSVGEMDWHSGPVSSKLPEGKKRKVILSRWFKPLRIVPDTEAAQKIATLLDGENIPVPRNVVTPSLLEELDKLGVQIGDQRGLKDAMLSLKDSEGNQLTEAQAEFFKDSKVRDEDGNLLMVYHGTESDFTVFDRSKGRANMDIQGSFFSPWELDSKGYGRNVKPYYLNITNPASESEAYKALNRFKGQDYAGKKAAEYLMSKGYDGVKGEDELIAFYPEQIKSVDNLNPTTDPDIRYSLKTGPDGKSTASYTDAKVKEIFDRYSVKEDSTQLDYSQRYVTYISPSDFLSLTATTANIDRIKKAAVENYGKLDVAEMQDDTSGPFLEFDIETGEVVGHEGRHRMALLQNEGVEKVAIMLRPYPNERGKYDRKKLTKLLLTGEEFSSGTASGMVTIDEAIPLSNRYRSEVYEKFGDSTGSDFRYSLKGESDILKQNAQMKEMNDYLKAQMELTSNVTADRKKTEAYGKSVLREYSSYMDRDEFISELHSIYNDMSQEQVDFDSIMGRARDLSSKVIEQASVLNDDMYKRYKELIDNVRATPLAVQDVDKKEISYIVGDYNEFRKKNMGTLNLVNPETGGSSVDTYYQELVELYPEFFDEDIVNQGEQLVRIRNVVESLRPYRENPHSDFMDEAAEYLAQDLIDNFFEIPQTRPTFADKQQKRVDKERIKAANQRRDLREKQKARIEQIKSQHRDKTKELIAAEKEKRVGEVAKLKEKFKQKEQTKNQKISDRQLRLRIQRLVKEMNAKLLSPTDKHHVPEGLRKPVAEFLKSIDFSTSRQGQGTRNRLANLNLAYSRIAAGMDRGDSEYYLDIDPDLINMISDLQETIGDKRVVDMNSDELMKLWQITRIVRSSINNYNKLLASGLREEVVFKGESVLEDLRKSKDKTESGYDMIRKIDNMVNLDMVAPADYFEMLGDTMYDLYGNLRRGLDKKVENTKTITEYMQKLLKDQDIKTWTGKKAETTDFTLKSGKKITLTPAQVMSLYLLEKRDQARGHIYGGGIKHAPIVTKKKGKTTITKTFEPARVTPEDVSMIIGNLTAEQKKIADGISDFLNTYTSDWGNEVSMALYGYKKFTEKNYFPIKSDDNYLVSEFGMPNDSMLRSKGFTKALTKGANNPIIIDDIFDVFAKITDDSSSYNAFVLPLSDLQKVVNYKGLTGTVKQAIEKRYGAKGVAYFRKLMQDINGGIRTEVGTELVKTLLSNFKAATMGLNIRVIVQQPTALIRATAMIDPKYLAAGVVKKGDWKKVTQYSQIAQWKSWGYFSMDIGRQMKDIIMGEKSMRDLAFKWIQDADNMAWGKLWNAVELETKDRHPNLIEGTDMFYEIVAKRFNDIVDRTQVVDTVLHRPQILRSNDTLVKVYTSFMGEPLKSFNMLRTNIKRAVETGNPEDKERAARTSVAWLSSMLVNVLIVSLIDIYRGKGEDEDEFLEKYAKLVGGNALNDAIGMFPFVRDIVSMANGFSPKRMDMEGFNDVTNATKRLGKAGAALIKGEPVENTPLYILKDTASAFSKLLGVPIKNVFREIESASNLVIDGFSAYEVEYALTKSMYNINHSENRGKFVDIMYKAMMEDDMESAKRIYNDMLVNGVSKSYIEYGYKTRQRKTLDGTSEIELVNDLVQKWNKTPESERTEAMKKDFESQAKAAYESLVEQGYTEEEVTKAVKRLKVPDKTMTMKELLKLYDAAKKDKSKQQEFYEAANRMIDAGYDEEDILAAIEVHKE